VAQHGGIGSGTRPRYSAHLRPDTSPVEHAWDGHHVDTRNADDANGLEKETRLDAVHDGAACGVTHRIVNRNPWAIELAVWAAVRHGSGFGRAIYPRRIQAASPTFSSRSTALLWHSPT